MSRCFPFPPPGYEKKPRSDHVDFLIKEKRKEKKHKKKEKREGKEKKDKHKDKDPSKDKHREKKDKKEKHRDKSKKGKDGGKDNKRVSNERNDRGHTDGHKTHNEEELAEGHKADVHKISSFTEELVRRIADEGATNQMGKQITSEFQIFENRYNSSEKGRDMGNEIAHNITVPGEEKMDMASAMENRDTSDAMPQSTEQRRADGMGRSTYKDAKRHVEAKEKAKEWKVEDKKGDKYKDKDGEKKHKRKDRDRDKEKAKEEKRRKEECKHKEQDKSMGTQQRGHVHLQNIEPPLNPQENKQSAGGEKRLKRKEINGFLHEKEVRPDKLSRPSPSSQLPFENGGELDPSHIVIPCASDRHEAANIVAERVPESKEHKINVLTNVQPPSKSGPPPVAGATGSGKTSKKPPHPDEKYLSQLLCLPKMEEYPVFDDQEWLLSRDDARQKPRAEPEAEETPQVWDKALRIDPADTLALPYVLPY